MTELPNLERVEGGNSRTMSAIKNGALAKKEQKMRIRAFPVSENSKWKISLTKYLNYTLTCPS